jgi:hypothetical protein
MNHTKYGVQSSCHWRCSEMSILAILLSRYKLYLFCFVLCTYSAFGKSLCTVEPLFTNLIRSWRPFITRNVRQLKLHKKTTKHNEIQETAQRIQAGMCTEWKLRSNWYSPTDTPSLLPTVVAGLCVRYLRHRLSPETFFVWKICSWTNSFVMKGVHEPRFHCTYKRCWKWCPRTIVSKNELTLSCQNFLLNFSTPCV